MPNQKSIRNAHLSLVSELAETVLQHAEPTPDFRFFIVRKEDLLALTAALAEHCSTCGARFTQEAIDGGRCLVCEHLILPLPGVSSMRLGSPHKLRS